MASVATRDPDRTIISAGIDWLTLTSVSRETKRGMSRYFEHILAADLQQGYKPVPGGMCGFYGKRTRHALLAEKGERTMLQVSGSAAQRVATLAKTGDNCTRLDVQLTIRVGEENVSKFIRAQDSRCARHRTIRGKRPDRSLVVKNGKAQTFYLGSRTSDVFVRIYDKFAESGDEAHRGAVRMEIEYKGKRAASLWSHLAAFTLTNMSLLQLLVQDLEERGLDVTGIDLERQDIVLPKPKPSKENVTWGWWASQVAPSVARSVAERGWYTAFSILFGHTLTEHDKTVIMNSVSLAWGN